MSHPTSARALKVDTPQKHSTFRFRPRSTGWFLLLLGAAACGPSAEEGRRSTSAEPAVDVMEATIPALQDAMAGGEITSVGLVEAYLARIEAYDRDAPRLNSILRVNPNALADARALDEERARGEARGPLHGIPILLKDNYDTSDMPTTASSVALGGWVPPDDAYQVRKLREAGAVILAKTNMHELAVGITTISSLGGQTRNPYDPARNPGGSSGGTGAAVAASFGAVGWGTDTCGSIRIPSCHNNLFGLRATKGLSSIDGIVPLSHTQDVGGPLARTVTDLAIALDATVGQDPADPATGALEGRTVPSFFDALDPEALQGARVGVLSELFGDPPRDQEVDSILRAAVGRMADLGADTLSVEIPDLIDLIRPTGVIDHEFKFDLRDYLAATPDAPVGSLDEILGSGLLHSAIRGRIERRNRPEAGDPEEYGGALEAREALGAAIRRAMDAQRLDALVYPAMTRRPSVIGEPQSGSNCQLSAGSGFPALAMPAGFTEGGLPTGLELLGRPFDDARLVGMAYAYEQGVNPRRPPPTTPPLVQGRPPPPILVEAVIRQGGQESGGVVTAEATFHIDVAAGTLDYQVDVIGIPSEDIYAVTINRVAQEEEPEEDEEAGESAEPKESVIHRLLAPGEINASGTIDLGNRGREDLLQGRLFLVLYAAPAPLGTLRTSVRLPTRDNRRG